MPTLMVSKLRLSYRKILTCKTEPDSAQKEIAASWSLLILIMLLIAALFVSYTLQTRRIQAVHETVISIFAGRHKRDLRRGVR